ncbi:hypothetical protein F3Y22_tig00116962pilonHSYRG01055 [Hibiscus syriacus]|uniref:F-box protein n=1 Tax=Hibiscus syriacus TaxID=106335 RepID=A0A6A2XU12_HIBSY|nr:hypothetical protein F3Y22_tig00116962pilonHSYRG01055 [Hibiscus syriacus]
MASLQASTFLLSSSSSSSKQIHSALSVPKVPSIRFSVPKAPAKGLSVELNTREGFINTIPFEKNLVRSPLVQGSSSVSMPTLQLYAILESITDRVEMHNNVGQQRDNWNTLLLNSINMIPWLALRQPAALGLLIWLQRQIETQLATGSPSKEDVKDAMEKVLALDKAYPLPLLGVMLEKFPESLEPTVWWPKIQSQKTNKEKYFKGKVESNGWTEELEMEMREVVEVIKRKDSEDYERLGNKALKMNKVLAASGPILTGIAAVGSTFMDSSNGSWAAIMASVAGALASAVNTLEHGGQVGMVFEMYRNNAGFFKHVQESIESTLSESDLDKRENGELFEMKVALQLGRSLSQLRDLAKKSSYFRIEGGPIDEFASKLF